VLLKELNWTDDVHMVGHSMGGYLATIYSLLYPEEISSLTNIDGFFNFGLSSQRGPLSKYLRSEMDDIVSQAPSNSRLFPAEQLRSKLYHHYGLSQVPKDVAVDIIDHVLENDFSSAEKGLMTQNWNPLMAKMLYNYDLGTFEELTKRLTFPVLHITSSQFNSAQSIFSFSHPPFPVDMDICLSSVDMMEDAAIQNDVRFQKEYVDGSHMLHLTHAAELAALLRHQLQLDSTK